ncbi:MAG: endonuclease NucS domain-containing protein [Nostoc sp.]
MLAGAALRKTGSSWEFASEAALEDFVWDNLQQLSGLKPLKRQYAVKGEICDILALNDTRQLVILELKNTQDRYVVQQLTRYYDNLLDEKPFQEQIDYSHPVRLLAIAPSFHKHNLIDRKHTKLTVNFLQVTVAQINQNFHLQLQDTDTNQTWSIPIPYQELDISTVSSNIPEPPQLLLDWLGACTGEKQQAILKLREKILSFDGRIEEKIEGKNTIRYGKGKAKPVAELCYQSKTHKLVIFLWLPVPSSLFTNSKEMIGRMRLWTDGASVTDVGHVPEGFGRMKLQSEWDAIPREKRPPLMQSLSSKSLIPVPINWYGNLRDTSKIHNTLESLADLSLGKWLARI